MYIFNTLPVSRKSKVCEVGTSARCAYSEAGGARDAGQWAMHLQCISAALSRQHHTTHDTPQAPLAVRRRQQSKLTRRRCGMWRCRSGGRDARPIGLQLHAWESGTPCPWTMVQFRSSFTFQFIQLSRPRAANSRGRFQVWVESEITLRVLELHCTCKR